MATHPAGAMTGSADELLRLTEEELLRQCRFEAYKSGGPGGQKRNKTASAVRLTHVPSGLWAHSGDFRSQVENRTRALHRLRLRLAAELRGSVVVRGYEPPAWTRAYCAGNQLHVNPRNADFARLAAHALDLLRATDGRVGDVAALLGVSTSSLVKFLKEQREIWDAAVAIRRASGLPANPFSD